MKQLRFTTTEPWSIIGGSEPDDILVTPKNVGEMIRDDIKGDAAYIHGKAQDLAGFDIPTFIDGNLGQLDLPVDQQNILMLLPSGQYRCKSELDGRNRYLITLANDSINENKKTVQIITGQLQKIIKEGVARLHKKALIENRIKKINEELSDISNSSKPYKSATNNELAQYIINLSNSLNANNSSEEKRAIEQDLKDVKDELNYRKSIKESDIKLINKTLSENSEVASPAMIDTINGYLEAALWTEEEELGPSNIESDVSFEAKVDAYTDIKKFKQLAGELIAQSGLDDEQIGHDLWLTRNGHGAGFWDRGLGEIGDKLADIASGMGSKYAYVGDDGLIYID